MNSNYQQNIYKPQPSGADKRFWEWVRLRSLMIIFLVAVLPPLTIFPCNTKPSFPPGTDALVCSPVSSVPFMIINTTDNLQGRGSNLPPQQLWLYEYVFTTSWPHIDLGPQLHAWLSQM